MKSCLILLASIATIALAEPEVRPSGLKVEYTLVPETCERKAMNGQMLTMHYTGTLEDGSKFDSSVDRNEPFKFQIGVGQVIKGWEEGVLGMCIGEKRRLIVPPELGYGDQVMIRIYLAVIPKVPVGIGAVGALHPQLFKVWVLAPKVFGNYSHDSINFKQKSHEKCYESSSSLAKK